MGDWGVMLYAETSPGGTTTSVWRPVLKVTLISWLPSPPNWSAPFSRHALRSICSKYSSVSMDALMVEVDESVTLGDEVVLLGRQGDEEIGADQVADTIGIIPWEVLCSLSHRPPRRYP